MPLVVTKWIARVVGERGHFAVLPFDARYDGDDWDNQLPLDKIGSGVTWEVFVDFNRQMDPGEPDYPHFARLEDNGAAVTLPFNCKWSSRAGIQWGRDDSRGPRPAAGRRNVRITLLNAQQQPLLSQSGVYVVG